MGTGLWIARDRDERIVAGLWAEALHDL
jgi:hypothetical protein